MYKQYRQYKTAGVTAKVVAETTMGPTTTGVVVVEATEAVEATEMERATLSSIGE